MWLDQGSSLLSGYAWELLRALLALLCLLGVAWLLVRSQPGRRLLGLRKTHGPLELVQYLPLGPRRALYVVRCEGRTLVLGAAENGPLTLLAELEGNAPAVAAAEPVTTPRSEG
jgi:flagellar biogenesis protein FliO